MFENDLISVIVPVYNCEKYVRETLDSIINQTYGNLEILLINDGSTDNSGTICDEYRRDDRVRVFHRENVGLAATREFGVENCHGAYFVTLDADDYVSLDFVEKLYRTVTENDADISVCGVSCFTDGTNDNRITYMPPDSYKKLCVTKEVLASDFYGIFMDMLLSDVWNKMYRTQFVKETGVKFELPGSNIGSDLAFNHRITLHCPIFAVCGESLLFHRNRSGSLMTSIKATMHEGYEWITEKLLAECDLLGLSIPEQISEVYYWLLGSVVSDIQYHGRTFRENHKAFKGAVAKNKRFLKKHRCDLMKHKAFQPFKMGDSYVKLPAFVLTNALWLDAATLCITVLRKIKYNR